ncbi:hypothetical protein ACH347_32250 [Saccharopolyspora sp. 5N102]|uniref:hypothetical protein n=1 Tax=Saccharopolyspora sp. 5N102 TaxID=3375155 RepID=UPI0037A1A663
MTVCDGAGIGPIPRPYNTDAAVVSGLLAVAEEIARWIPTAAYQDPRAAEADRQHVPLAQLQVPLA